jgi:cyclophilin family peptidyl-prolyl cis-trans isomerase
MSASRLSHTAALLFAAIAALSAHDVKRLMDPSHKDWREAAPAHFQVRLDTTRGTVLIDVVRALAPIGADRFYNLVRFGYYDDARFFRVVAGRWAQFGISGDPAIAQTWRGQPIADDPRVESNVRGAVALAWAVPNGRTTQVFVNLGDNSKTLDAQGFAPFGRVVEGMDAVDSLYDGYGEESGGGIRGGRQDPLFELGNEYLLRRYPRLDYIRHATIE